MASINGYLKMMNQLGASVKSNTKLIDKAEAAINKLRAAMSKRLGFNFTMPSPKKLLGNIKEDISFLWKWSIFKAKQVGKNLMNALSPKNLFNNFRNALKLPGLKAAQTKPIALPNITASPAKKLSSQQNLVSSGVKNAVKLSTEWLKNLKSIVGKYLTIKNLQKLQKMTVGGALENQSLLDNFIARTGSVETGTNMFEKFKAQALAAGQDVNQSLQNTLSFYGMTKSSDNLLKINDLINRAATFDPGGKGIDGAASIVKSAMKGDTSGLQQQFGFGSGVLQEKNIEKLGKSGDIQGVIKALEELFEMRGMGEEAYKKLMASPAKQLEKLSGYVNNAFAEAGQGAITALGPLLTMLNEAFEAGKFDFFFNALHNSIALIANIASWAAELILNNLDIVKNILVAVGLVALIVGAQFLIAWLQAIWPLLLIIGVIALIIGVLNYFGVSTEEIIGFIAGLFMGFVASAWNLIAMLWNMFLSFAEFLANLFVDPIYAIEKLFYDLNMGFYGIIYDMLRAVESFASGFTNLIVKGINGAIKGLKAFGGVINKIFGVNIGEFELLDENNVHALSDGVKSIMDSFAEPVSKKDVYNFDKAKMDMMDVDKQFNNGQKFGSGLFDKAGKALGGLLPQNDWDKPKVPGEIGGVGKVGEVGKINETVDISSEDIKMMRELAELKNIQNFVSLTPSITFGDTHVRNESDLDTIFVRITEQLNKDIASSVNAVYT